MSRTLSSQADVVTEAERLFAAMVTNSAELSHLAGSRIKLENQLVVARELLGRQANLSASKQEASTQLREQLNAMTKLINLLRVAVKEHFGSRSDRLVEFGVQPFRGRRRKVVAEPVPPSPEPVEVTGTQSQEE